MLVLRRIAIEPNGMAGSKAFHLVFQNEGHPKNSGNT